MQRIREGADASKVAIVGRSMDGVVTDTGKHFHTKSIKAETFSLSDAAKENWAEKLKDHRASVSDPNARLPFEEVKKTFGYDENKEWAEKLVREKYTIIDMGDPLGKSESEGLSAFYEIEKTIIFGEGQYL